MICVIEWFELCDDRRRLMGCYVKVGSSEIRRN